MRHHLARVAAVGEVIAATYRIQCDHCGNTGTPTLARGEDSAPWEPKEIRAAAQRVDGFAWVARKDVCRTCLNPDPTLPGFDVA